MNDYNENPQGGSVFMKACLISSIHVSNHFWRSAYWLRQHNAVKILHHMEVLLSWTVILWARDCVLKKFVPICPVTSCCLSKKPWTINKYCLTAVCPDKLQNRFHFSFFKEQWQGNSCNLLNWEIVSF